MRLIFLLLIFGDVWRIFQQRGEKKADIDHSVQLVPKIFVLQNVKQNENTLAKNKTKL